MAPPPSPIASPLGALFIASTLAYLLLVEGMFRVLMPESILGLPFALWAAALKAVPVLSLSKMVETVKLPAAMATYSASLGQAFLLSAAGDFVLGLGSSQACFLGGLAAFLLAHLLFARAFLSTVKAHAAPVAIASAIAPALLLAFLWPHLSSSAEAAALQLPVVAYAAAITAMFYSAMVRDTSAMPSKNRAVYNWWLTVGGAVLFMASDAVLAWAKFVPGSKPTSALLAPLWKYPQLLLMVLYFSGQLFLAAATWSDPPPQPAAAAAAAAAGPAGSPKRSSSSSKSPAAPVPAPKPSARKEAVPVKRSASTKKGAAAVSKSPARSRSPSAGPTKRSKKTA